MRPRWSCAEAPGDDEIGDGEPGDAVGGGKGAAADDEEEEEAETEEAEGGRSG